MVKAIAQMRNGKREYFAHSPHFPFKERHSNREVLDREPWTTPRSAN
jgi:hypothetical protein